MEKGSTFGFTAVLSISRPTQGLALRVILLGFLRLFTALVFGASVLLGFRAFRIRV